ncbi:uncharacterized protein OCT59_026342 [Rhizophagus irregularis]|nr:hypothetical protein OCT59_026342 [Rhizophagus irregularis]
MTDSTKSRKKLVYAEELNHIADLLETLPHSETTIAVLDDVHQKINHIRENDAIATQVRGIALKIPIGKVASMIVAMIPTRGDEGADQIAHLTHQSQHFLLERDVLNVYKQDDRAALRTFHSNTLIQISVSGTLTDDLFLLRELCDAYLNRTIDHKTRIEMIQQRVSYRDKISRAGIIDTNRDRNSAAGYIFDIDGTSLPHKIIERLRIWPATDDIQECTRVAFNEALSLTKYIHTIFFKNNRRIIKKSKVNNNDIDNHEESSISEFIAHIEKMTDVIYDEEDNQHNELNELINTSDEASLNRSSIVGNAALEISRILSDSQNENDQLYEENSDDDENEEIIQQLPSFGEFPDIQYIIQHSRPIPITFTHFNNFFTDDILNIITLLQIHQCHDAFSRNLQSNSHQIVNRNNNQIQEINGNAVNELITEITANNIDKIKEEDDGKEGKD